MMKKLVDVKTISSKFGLSRATVYKLVRAGRIPAVKIGNSWRFKPTDIEKFLHDKSITDKRRPLFA